MGRGRGRVRVGVNGLGRLGRVVLRTCFKYEELEVAAVNDPVADCAYICYLIKHDSTHGKFKGKVEQTENGISVNDRPIHVFHHKSPQSIPWHKADIDYVVESSGMFTTMQRAAGHLANSRVKRVIVTAPCNDVPMILLGVNQEALRSDTKIISCASSTLYCLAPIMKVLDDNFGVVEGFITSIHAMTPALKPLDSICSRNKHYRDHRGILQNIIPATTSACKSLGKLMPHLKNKLSGLAYRVPIVDVSVLDLTIRLQKSTNLAEIKKCVEAASISNMKYIISISDEESVSSDFIGDKHSCILDTKSSIALSENFYKLVCWYENEYSYACRVAEMIIFADDQSKSPNKLIQNARKQNVLETYSKFIQMPKLVTNTNTRPNIETTKEQQKPIQNNNTQILSTSTTSQCVHDKCKTLVIFNIPTNLCQDKGNLIGNNLEQTDTFNSYPEGIKNEKILDDKITSEFQKGDQIRETKNRVETKDLKICKEIKSNKTKSDFKSNNKFLDQYFDNGNRQMVSRASSVINIPEHLSLDYGDHMKSVDIVCITSNRNIIGFKDTTEVIQSVSLPQNASENDDDDYFHIINDLTESSDQEHAIDVIKTDVSLGNSTNASFDFTYTSKSSNENDIFNVNVNEFKITDVEISDSFGFKLDNDVKCNKILQKAAVTENIRCIETKFKSVENLFEAGSSFTSLHKCSGTFSMRTERKANLYDKVESASDTDSENSFQVNERKSTEIKLSEVTDSFDELEKLDKICRIIEISDDLSDNLFSKLREAGSVSESGWSVREFCDKIDLDEFIKDIFRKR